MNRRATTSSADIALFVALMATAVALGGALAHAFELPEKISLPRNDYFTVQQIYRGWDRLGFVIAVQLAAIVAVAYLYRRHVEVRAAALIALMALVSAQAVFWIFTFPTNKATANWTLQPYNWEQLRATWEYSHLAGALFQLLAMGALIIAALRSRRVGA